MAVSGGVVAALEEAGVVLKAGKRRVRSLYWRLRAQIRRQVGRNRGRERKRRFSFQYDPFSYALNFDDGCSA